jgi:dTDP-glucose pyrophosphorylase
MRDFNQHLIFHNATLKVALSALNRLGIDTILFVVDEKHKLLGSLTDGDVRRGLLKGRNIEDNIMAYIQRDPKFISKSKYNLKEIIDLRSQNLKIIPVLDEEGRIINIVNFRLQHSYLPMDVLVMAGGRGSRLSPMTDTVPKPLLQVGNKAIIDHNIDRLISFGIDDFHISIRYLGEQLVEHYQKRNIKGIKLEFIRESDALGTLGAAGLIESYGNEYVLITNSDILTNINYEDFFLDFLEKEADMSIVTIPHRVDVPYAVVETRNDVVLSFQEKPTYTYYCNGGIYIVKREILDRVPKNCFYNATDLMEDLISDGAKLVSYPLRQFWLDIGRPEDFEKANRDIKHLEI